MKSSDSIFAIVVPAYDGLYVINILSYGDKFYLINFLLTKTPPSI